MKEFYLKAFTIHIMTKNSMKPNKAQYNESLVLFKDLNKDS